MTVNNNNSNSNSNIVRYGLSAELTSQLQVIMLEYYIKHYIKAVMVQVLLIGDILNKCSACNTAVLLLMLLY